MTPMLGIMASAATGSKSSSFDSIATFSATGTETTYTFSSIPSTYKHLQIRAIFQRNFGNQIDIGLRFNGVTAANYSGHYLNGDGTTVTANASPSSSYIAVGTGNGTSVASTLGASIIDIHDYASTTKNKTVRSFGGVDTNGVGVAAVRLWSGAWLDATTAITSVTIYTFGDGMNTGTTFALYGIKG
jgi:hypothetical protein